MSPHNPSKAALINQILALTVIGLFLVPFTGISSDHAQYLLPVLRANDPNFALNDWFVQNTRSFHPFFEWWCILISRWSSLNLSLFLFYLLNQLLLSAAILNWANWLLPASRTYHKFLIVALCAATLSLGHSAWWGGYSLAPTSALAASLFYPFALFAVLSAFQRQATRTVLWLSLTLVVHLAGGAILIPAVILIYLGHNMEVSIKGLLTLIVCGIFALVAANLLTCREDPSIYSILFFGRSPHHFSPIHQSIASATHTGILFILGFILSVRREISSFRRVFTIWLIANVALILASITALYLIPIPFMVMLFPFRLLPIVHLLNLVFSISILMQAISLRSCIFAMLIATICLTLGVNELASYASLLALLISYFIKDKAVLHREKMALIGLFSTIVVLLRINLPIQNHSWPSQAVIEAATAIKLAVPVGSIVMAPPNLGVLRLLSGRALIVDTKAFPVFPSEMKEWANRMKDLTGLDPVMAKDWLNQIKTDIFSAYQGHYSNQNWPEIQRLATKYQAEYLLVSLDNKIWSERLPANYTTIWESEEYKLISLR